MAESDRVNKRLDGIHEKKSKSIVVAEDGSLLESGKDKLKNLNLEELETVEEIENALDGLGKEINKKITSLHTQDEVQLKALEDNAKLRKALKEKLQARIKEQEKELSFAADVET